MGRGVRLGALALGLALVLLAAPAARADVLVRYSFDDDTPESGPDTYRVFERGKGDVVLDASYRTSGDASLRLRDVAGNGDFPELQGYFPRREAGRVRVHFALLVADPLQTLNVGLAGPAGFRPGRDGLAVWLETRDGFLVHVTDGIPRRLLRLEPLRWYRVELDYDVTAGRYDLWIGEEGQPEPLVALRDQASVASQPASAVDKLSFIGDRGSDTSSVVYWVDDVLVEADGVVPVEPLVLPGRRRLFFEHWFKAEAELRSALRCPALLEARDLGAGSGGARDATVRAADLWRRGCRALEQGQPRVALELFEGALRLAPGARLVDLCAGLALAALGRLDEAEARLWRGVPDRGDDARWATALALIALARDDADGAERSLRPAALAARSPGGERERARYYFVLLFQGRHADAERFALESLRQAGPDSAAGARWEERVGDALVFQGDYRRALESYRRVEKRGEPPSRLLLKLSDVYLALDDVDEERRYRERIYGTLFE